MYVSGPPTESQQALRSGELDPRFDPTFYQDYDNLGFSFKSIAKAVKKVASPIQKVVGKVTAPVIKVAAKVAAPVTSIGAGILRNVPGGGLIVGAVSGVKNLVTGNKANNLQRIATSTIKQAAPLVYATPVSSPPAVIMAPVLPTQDSPAAVVQRQKKSIGQRILGAGSRLKTNAGIAATAVSKVADQAGAIAAAADSAATAGDQVGARRLRDTALRLKALAESGQATAQQVASVIQQGGAAAQGAAAGAVAGAGAEQASQGISDFLGTTTGKLTAAGLVAAGLLLVRGGGSGGGGSRRRAVGDSHIWE